MNDSWSVSGLYLEEIVCAMFQYQRSAGFVKTNLEVFSLMLCNSLKDMWLSLLWNFSRFLL